MNKMAYYSSLDYSSSNNVSEYHSHQNMRNRFIKKQLQNNIYQNTNYPIYHQTNDNYQINNINNFNNNNNNNFNNNNNYQQQQQQDIQYNNPYNNQENIQYSTNFQINFNQQIYNNSNNNNNNNNHFKMKQDNRYSEVSNTSISINKKSNNQISQEHPINYKQQQQQIDNSINTLEYFINKALSNYQNEQQKKQSNHISEQNIQKTPLKPQKTPNNQLFPKFQSLEYWNFVGETTGRIYQTLNSRADFHKTSAHSRFVFVKKVFSWLATHDKDYLNSHKTLDLIIAISDILNMIISLIELHRAPETVLYLIIYSSDRFVERTGINHHQIFNLLLTSAIVNLKFWNETIYIQNKTIADIFSFSVKDLNTMERRFLYGLDYNLCVTPNELDFFLKKIKKSNSFSSTSSKDVNNNFNFKYI
ncbi:hypothetical protein CYY_008545 [Polysphondylium violaceum]|uniref:Cyclin N-terminal domain-containing protein n=1 Tax=Polysphondylium violaceum TaxID=133409 RepID=A0A8J4PNB8_9MYCE|nr:hypothetical protein CYY_008545 [Polysphondylium violaceum]